MPQITIPQLNHSSIQNILEINSRLINHIKECQENGWFDDAKIYQLRLLANLTQMGALVDSLSDHNSIPSVDNGITKSAVIKGNTASVKHGHSALDYSNHFLQHSSIPKKFPDIPRTRRGIIDTLQPPVMVKVDCNPKEKFDVDTQKLLVPPLATIEMERGNLGTELVPTNPAVARSILHSRLGSILANEKDRILQRQMNAAIIHANQSSSKLLNSSRSVMSPLSSSLGGPQQIKLYQSHHLAQTANSEHEPLYAQAPSTLDESSDDEYEQSEEGDSDDDYDLNSTADTNQASRDYYSNPNANLVSDGLFNSSFAANPYVQHAPPSHTQQQLANSMELRSNAPFSDFGSFTGTVNGMNGQFHHSQGQYAHNNTGVRFIQQPVQYQQIPQQFMTNPAPQNMVISGLQEADPSNGGGGYSNNAFAMQLDQLPIDQQLLLYQQLTQKFQMANSSLQGAPNQMINQSQFSPPNQGFSFAFGNNQVNSLQSAQQAQQHGIQLSGGNHQVGTGNGIQQGQSFNINNAPATMESFFDFQEQVPDSAASPYQRQTDLAQENMASEHLFDYFKENDDDNEQDHHQTIPDASDFLW